eukprot:jgi/Mesen1/9405/ME000614S08660
MQHLAHQEKATQKQQTSEASSGSILCGQHECKSTSIADLPDDILGAILRAATWHKQGSVDMKHRARLAGKADVPSALSTLQTYESVTHVRLDTSNLCGQDLLSPLAEGFPLLTSFDIELWHGWEAFPDLAPFLSRRTSLGNLRLRFVDRPTLADLPSLMAFHLAVSNVGAGARLPAWLGELRSFASLSVTCNRRQHPRQLLRSLAAMWSLRELRLHFASQFRIGSFEIGAAELAPLAGLRSLTALSLSYQRLSDAESAVECLARAAFGPRLHRLHLRCDRLPRLRAPMPLLEELLLDVSAPGVHVQSDLFAHAPALRSLDLRLEDTPLWPRLREHLTGLTSLGVDCGGERGGLCDVAGMGALRELRIGNCRLLECMPGVFDLGPATAVALVCLCPGFLRDPFESYADYAQARRPCQRMTDGMARQLFRNTRRRRLTAGGPGRAACPLKAG